MDGTAPTGPTPTQANAIHVAIGPALVTVGATASASLQAPIGVSFVPGSFVWSVTPSNAADVVLVPGREDSVQLVLKTAGTASVAVHYKVDAGSGADVVGGAATGLAPGGNGVAASRSAPLYIAAFGGRTDSTMAASGATGGSSIARATIIGEGRDSTILGVDGFSAIYAESGITDPGFDWVVHGSGAIGLNPPPGSSIVNALRATVGTTPASTNVSQATAPVRTATTLQPTIGIVTIHTGVDTVIMTHRSCVGSCADTLIVSVANSPKSLRVESASPKTLTVGLAANPPIMVDLLDVGGQITPVTGTVVTAAPSTGLTLLAGATASTTAGVAPFSALTAVGKVGQYHLLFSTTTGTTPVDYVINLVAGAPVSMGFVTPFPSAWPDGTAILPCPSVALFDVSGNQIAPAGVTVSLAGAAGGVGTATTDANGLATFCGVQLPAGAGDATFTLSAQGGLNTAVTVHRASSAVRIAVTPPSASAVVGGSATFVATAQDANGTAVAPFAITWSSSNTAIATVDAAGAVRAVAVGTVTITAAGSGLTGTAQFSVVPGAADPGKSTIAISSSILNPLGQATVTIVVRDALGNIITSATPAMFAASVNNGSLGTFTCVNGTCTALYTAPATAGTAQINVSFGLAPISNPLPAITIQAGAATKLALTTSAATAASGAPFGTQPVVTVQDANGNTATTSTSPVTMTVSTGGTVVGTATVNAVAGVATFTNVGLSGLVGPYTLTYSAGGLTSATQSITLGAGAVSAATSTLTLSPTSVAPGGNSTVTVTLKDASGNIVTGATAAAFVATPSAGSIGAFTCVNGVCTATYTAPVTAGTPTIGVTIGGLAASGSPATITVAAGAATQLVLTTNAAGAASGVAFTTQPVVTVKDGSGNSVTTSTAAVTMTVSAGGTVIGTATVNAVAGVATFSGVGISGTAGTAYTLTFASAGLTSATQTITPVAGVASQLVITGAATQIAGAAQTITVTAQDASGNTATTYTGAKNLTFSGASVAPSAATPTLAATAFGTATSVTFTNGVATASMVLVKTETAIVATTDGTLSAATTNRLTVVVSAGAASAATSTETLSPTNVAPNGTSTVTVTVKDAFGNIVTGATSAVFVATPSAGSVGAFTCVSGVCTATYTAPATASSPTVAVTIGGTAVGGSPATLTVSAGAATKLTLTTSAAGAASGAAFTTQPVVAVQDASGNVVTTSTAAVTMTVSAGGTVVGTATVNAVAGVATFSGVGISGTAGTAYTLTFASGGLASTTQSITPVAGVASQLVITGAGTQIAGAAQTITVTARDASGNAATTYTGAKSLTFSGAAVSPNSTKPTVAATAFGTSTSLTFTNGVATGSMILTTVETAVVATTDGTLSAATTNRLTVVVSAGAASAATSTESVSPTSLAPNGTATVTVTVKDALGNIITGATSAVFVATPSAGSIGAFTCVNGVCTATYTAPATAGTPTVGVTIGGTAVSGSPVGVTVSAGAAAKLALTTNAATAVSGAAFGTQPVVAIQDAAGNVTTSTASVTMTVSAGGTVVGTATVSAVAGVATFTNVGLSGLIGSYTLTFASSGLTSATQPVTLVAGAATQLAITGTGTQTAGVAQTITVTAQDASGNTATTYTGAKSLTFSGASVSPNSTKPTVAGTAFGTGTSLTFASGVATGSMILSTVETAIVATTDGTLSATGGNRLSVVVSAAAANATTTTESVSPASVGPSGTATVTVTVKDAFGNIITGATSAAFVATPSAGSIGTFTCVSGVCTATYTAPATTSSPTIAVTVGGTAVSGSPATVTVIAGAATQLALTTSAAGSASGAAFTTQPVVAIKDGSGNIVTTSSASVAMTVSVGATTLGTTTVAAVSGIATFTGVGINGTAGTAYTLTFASGGLASATQSITPTAGAATQLVITGSGTQTAGVAQTITVTARDASGNAATTYTGAKSLTFSGAAVSPNSTKPTVAGTAFGTSTSLTFASGVATGSMILSTVETAVVATTDGTLSATGGNRLSVAVSGAAASATTSTESVSPTALGPNGTATVTVTVKDAFGNILTGATSAVFVATPSAGSIGTFTCVNGVCTATYTAPATVGSPTIGVTIGGTAVSGSPATVTVTAGAATQLVITGTGTQTAGVAQTITLTAQDASGNTATTYTGAKSLTFSGAAIAPNSTNPTVSATNFGSATSVTFTNGVATASMVLVKTETAVVAATDGTLSATGGNRLTVVVSAAAASATTTTESASPTSVGPSGTSTVTVTVRDAFGNVITGATSAIFVATPSAGSLGTFTCVSGVCTATYTAPATASSPTIGVTIGGTAVSGSPATVTVVAGPASQIAINAGNAQTATAGAAVAVAPSVIVKDASNNPVSGVSVTFAVATGGGSVTGGSATTNASGIATVGSWTLGTTAGANSITATSTGLTGSPLTFTATGVAGAATQIAINAGNGQSATVGTAVTTAPSVIVKDANNNVVSGVSVTFAVATGGGSGTGLSATTNASGIATVGSWTLGTTVGSNTLTATST
ncbi:MAG TPA: invasin domain 3-containing protein, partial [Gemmatimonadaceae bacterium]|nr:invasin domain 3-containing protein [Gemmatimonadaceae bacterium]